MNPRRLVFAAALALSLIVPSSASAVFPGEQGRIAFSSDSAFPRSFEDSGNIMWRGGMPACDVTDPAAFVQALVEGAPCAPSLPEDATSERGILGGGGDAASPPASSECRTQTKERGLIGGEPDEELECGFEIYTMNPDGSDVRRLTNDRFKDNKPAYSPDGSRIAFESRRGCLDDDPEGDAGGDGCGLELYVINADGSGLRRLTHNTADDSNPTWSPDGTKIAFESDRAFEETEDEAGCSESIQQTVSEQGSCDRIWVVDANANAASADPPVTKVSNGPGDDILPNWSPDGTRIAHVQTTISALPLEARGDPIEGTLEVSIEVVTRAADGSGEETVVEETNGCTLPITSQPDAEFILAFFEALNECRFDLDPNWSPDSARIAFHEAIPYGSPFIILREGEAARRGNGFVPFGIDNDVFFKNANGSGEPTRVTGDGGPADNDNETCASGESSTACVSDIDPVFSPDGGRIAFHSDRDAPGTPDDDPDTEEVEQDPDTPENEPCGGAENCDFEIFTVKTDGSDLRQLTRNSFRQQSPSDQPVPRGGDSSGLGRIVVDFHADWARFNQAPVSSAAAPACTGPTGEVPIRVEDTPGVPGADVSGPRLLRVTFDGGAEQVFQLAGGNPVTQTITVPEGRRVVSFSAEDGAGNREAPPNSFTTIRDVTAPTLSITSRQGKRTYAKGETAAVRIAAADDVGLAEGGDPSQERRRISTRTTGTKRVRVSARDLCGNVTTRTFRYEVLAAPRVGVAGVQSTGCTRRDFTARVSVRRGAAIRSVAVFVDGRRVRRASKRSLRVRVDNSSLARGMHRLRIVVTERSGRRTVRTVSFRRCGARRVRFTG